MKINTQPTQKRNRKGFTLVELLVVIAIIASLAGLSYGPIMKHLESSARTEAISNGKNIFSAMMGFMSTNDNVFPDDAKVTAAGGTPGASAEPYFQLLFDAGHISDEKYFYNKQNADVALATQEPDNNGTITSAENVWGYVEGLDPSDGRAPVLFDSSADLSSFLVNAWKGKAIILSVDGGAKAYNIVYTPPLDPANAAQAGVVNAKVNGSDAAILGLIPAGGVVKSQ